jgi:polyisoprenoid-binding protein YceI
MHALLLGALLAIDPVKSSVQFTVKHIFVDTVTGTVPIVSGTVDVADGTAIPTLVEATLDPTRFKTDEPDRDAAMQTPQWFDTKRFPVWTFVSTSILPTAKGFTMIGNLTIHGVTQPETLDVVLAGPPVQREYRATGHINRHAFGMQKAPLDPVIGEMVDVTIDVVTK